jgi:outer membrane protein assembly factor BamA
LTNENLVSSELLPVRSGANPAQISRNFQFIGGDTQLLGNFEYRIPIFGPVTLAAFADVGSIFNLRKTGTQVINSNFCRRYFWARELYGAGFAKQSES